MALPTTGNISLSSIRTEFATEASPGVGPGNLGSYYRNRVYGGTPGVIYPGLAATGVPSSGTIKFSDFYGTYNGLANRPPITFPAVDGGSPTRPWAYNDRIEYFYSGATRSEIFNLRTASAVNGPTFAAPTNGRYCTFLNDNGVWQDGYETASFDRTYSVNFVKTGNYTFVGSCDNYASVYLDGENILSLPDYGRTYSTTIRVTAGMHTLRYVGVNTGGPASAALTITGASVNVSGGQVFNFNNARFAKFEVWGAQGSTNGGYGGYASGYYVGTGELLVVCGSVGVWSEAGAGGYNGGGNGGVGGNGARGGGGGGTDIRTGSSLASRIIVAGGGGAGLYWRGYTWRGGGGGGYSGDTGVNANGESAQGGGGTQGGAGGGSYNQNSGFGQGGESIGYSNGYNTISGGGGGYYGGAAGNSAGGGSGYVGGVLDGTMANDVNTGDGRAVITILG